MAHVLKWPWCALLVGHNEQALKAPKEPKSFASRPGFWSNTYNFLNKGGWRPVHLVALISTLENSQMKKTLIAMAAVAAASGAMAQAVISGSYNMDLQNTFSNDKAAVGMGDVIVAVSSSEDLGGGMSISANTTFQGEGGRGGAISSNGYSLGIKGGFGGITLKNYLNALNNVSAGVSAEDDMNDVIGGYTFRTRLQYDFPSMIDGLSASLRWDTTETAPDAATDFVTGTGITKYNVTYAAGPLNLQAYGSNADGDSLGLVIASYDAGVAKVSVAMQDLHNQNEFAITAPLSSAVSAGLHVIDSDITDAYGARITYAMSKRSALSFNYVDSSLGGANAKVGDNFRVRLAHKF